MKPSCIGLMIWSEGAGNPIGHEFLILFCRSPNHWQTRERVFGASAAEFKFLSMFDDEESGGNLGGITREAVGRKYRASMWAGKLRRQS